MAGGPGTVTKTSKPSTGRFRGGAEGPAGGDLRRVMKEGRRPAADHLGGGRSQASFGAAVEQGDGARRVGGDDADFGGGAEDLLFETVPGGDGGFGPAQLLGHLVGVGDGAPALERGETGRRRAKG